MLMLTTCLRTLVVVLVCVVSPAFAADPVFPPGSRIGVVPPAGMTVSQEFQGFEDRAKGAMLAVSELSAQSHARMLKEFSADEMTKGGMEPVSREEIALTNAPALMVGARQQEGGALVRKWALVALVNDVTAVVVASVPDNARDAYPDAAIRAALASVVVRAKLSVDEMLGLLPYGLGDLGGFRPMRTAPNGVAVLTLGPNDTSLPVEQPYFMIAPRGAELPPPAERDRFAQRVLLEFTARPDLRIVSSEPLRLGNAQGHEVIAESKDERTGDELMLVQWLRFTRSGFIQMFGIAKKAAWADALPRMRALRDGFQAR